MKKVAEKIIAGVLLLSDLLIALLLTLLIYYELIDRAPSKGWVAMYGNWENFYTQYLFLGTLLALTIWLSYFGFCFVQDQKRIGYLYLVLPIFVLGISLL